jgi:hypothetical protein
MADHAVEVLGWVGPTLPGVVSFRFCYEFLCRKEVHYTLLAVVKDSEMIEL